MAGRENPVLHAPVPVLLSASALTFAPDPAGMGAATRLSLQGSSVQAGDASEGGSTPKHTDSKGSMLTNLEPCFISNFKRRLCSCFWHFSLKTLRQRVLFCLNFCTPDLGWLAFALLFPLVLLVVLFARLSPLVRLLWLRFLDKCGTLCCLTRTNAPTPSTHTDTHTVSPSPQLISFSTLPHNHTDACLHRNNQTLA